MEEEQFDATKEAVLSHVQSIFDEMEEELALSHQEKYALLEDALESASDEDELWVAFEQWYNDHAGELELELDAEELWEQALSNLDE